MMLLATTPIISVGSAPLLPEVSPMILKPLLLILPDISGPEDADVFPTTIALFSIVLENEFILPLYETFPKVELPNTVELIDIVLFHDNIPPPSEPFPKI